MTDFNATFTGHIPFEPTDEQKEQAAYDAGDAEAQRRLNTVVETEHADAVIDAMQDALDAMAKDIDGANALHCVGSVGTVVFDLSPTPPSASQQRRSDRKDKRASSDDEASPKSSGGVTKGTSTTHQPAVATR